jgi:hypothetical protein
MDLTIPPEFQYSHTFLPTLISNPKIALPRRTYVLYTRGLLAINPCPYTEPATLLYNEALSTSTHPESRRHAVWILKQQSELMIVLLPAVLLVRYLVHKDNRWGLG